MKWYEWLIEVIALILIPFTIWFLDPDCEDEED